MASSRADSCTRIVACLVPTGCVKEIGWVLRATVKPVFCRRPTWYDNKIQELCSYPVWKDMWMSLVGPCQPTPYDPKGQSQLYQRHFLVTDTFRL